MLFYSFQFLLFLPVVFVIYWRFLRAHDARMIFLLAASYVFYMSWNPRLILLLLASTSVDFFAVLAMGKTEKQWLRRLLLGASIGFNLGVLAVFKYGNFFLDNVHALAGWFGASLKVPHLSVVLPLAISFYTFETISYTIDGYYRKFSPCRRWRDYGLFISFFPHLVAGPIVRPKQFLPQLTTSKELRARNLSIGFAYFFYGLIKKILIADRLALFADSIFSAPGRHGTAATWLGVVAYAFQIYCDFSGYSNMAIGLARLFDFNLPVNFRTPYLARNVSEFWRRWHISLSTWLRDYLYVPLRGFAEGEWNVHLSLFLTMFFGGLWHGASWTFVAWGVYHGLLLIAHRMLHQNLGSVWKPTAALIPRFLREAGSRLLVFGLACVGWVFFRAETFQTALAILGRMFHPAAGEKIAVAAAPALIALVVAADIAEFIVESNDFDFEGRFSACPIALRVAVFSAALTALIVLAPIHLQPFIYFQF